MEPKLLEMKVQRHRLIAADKETMRPTGVGLCLAGVGTDTKSDVLSGLLKASSKRTLLLVSDDASLGVRVSDTADLARLAFQQINDTTNALRLAARSPVAVVLLDLDLPASTGWNATEQFLEDENGPPLALMTGRTDHMDLVMCVNSGMVLHKSIGPSRLLKQVHTLLARSVPDQERYRDCLQRLVRWLRPYEWSPPASDHRHWGINE